MTGPNDPPDVPELGGRLSREEATALRESFDEVPPRVEYTPTEKAESLFPAFAHLHHWAIEHEL